MRLAEEDRGQRGIERREKEKGRKATGQRRGLAGSGSDLGD